MRHMQTDSFGKSRPNLKREALTALFLAALCALGAILTTGQEGTRVCMDYVARALYPAEQPALRGAEMFRTAQRWTADRRSLLSELAELRDERRALRLFFGRREIEELKKEVRAQNRFPVVFRDPREWWEGARVAGGDESVPLGSAVLDGSDLVGVVTSSGGGEAWVRLITSSRFYAPVVVSETREIGVITGDDCGGVWMMYLPSWGGSRAGMKVLTALGSRLSAGISVGVLGEEKKEMLPGVDAYRVLLAADVFRLQYVYISAPERLVPQPLPDRGDSPASEQPHETP